MNMIHELYFRIIKTAKLQNRTKARAFTQNNCSVCDIRTMFAWRKKLTYSFLKQREMSWLVVIQKF